jgi:hypothetical protein
MINAISVDIDPRTMVKLHREMKGLSLRSPSLHECVAVPVAQKQHVDRGTRRPHGLRGQGEVAFGLAPSTLAAQGTRWRRWRVDAFARISVLAMAISPGALKGLLPDVIGTRGGDRA